MKRIINIIILLIFTMGMVGCTKPISMDSVNGVINDMRDKGYIFNVEEVEKDGFLPAERKWINLDKDGSITIYYFENNKEMEKIASGISEDGFGYSGKKNIFENFAVQVEWVYPPHLYKKDNIIVLYVGENKSIAEDLKAILGEPFAGYEFMK